MSKRATPTGYTIYGVGAFEAHAHATGALTLVIDGTALTIGPDNVEALRDVLRLASGLHSQARRRASRAAYTERYGEE